MSKDAMAMQRLREAAEKAKIELSSALQVGVYSLLSVIHRGCQCEQN